MMRPATSPQRKVPDIRVGIGGWAFAPWRDNFYPADLVQRRELEYASEHLRTIEINSSFYRAQKPTVYAKWAAQTPEGFVFSMKAPRYIVGRKKLADASASIQRFLGGGLAEMGDRLGPILWQLPATHPFDADDLAAFFDALPQALNGLPLRHALEVRHPSFACASYVSLARERGVATVFTDADDYPSLADVTGDFSYARLRCSQEQNAAGYSRTALQRWAEVTKFWAQGHDVKTLPHATPPVAQGKPRDVFAYFIGAAKARNPAAAMALQSLIDGAG